jgi:hypothetical protein
MNIPTWGELTTYHCSVENIRYDNAHRRNPHFEEVASRRYNFSPSYDIEKVRIVFLSGVLDSPDNKTLRRKGRFIWCKDLKYEGPDSNNMRQISFSVDKGQKRFIVAENNMLCLPSKTYVSNNRYFRTKEKIFKSFSSVFSYPSALRIMQNNSDLTEQEFTQLVKDENPYKPGTLVVPRVGYFYPERQKVIEIESKSLTETQHPCGIILGSCPSAEPSSWREFYRVRFGDTTYERIHPVEMEIINEV